MVFPWFLLALWLNMEALTRKLLSGSGKVTQAAAGHQAGERCTATRADSHVNQCSEIEPKSCENRSSPTVLGTCLSEYNGSLNLNKACLMAIWVSEELIHSGAHAHPGLGQELQPKGDTGSLGGCCTQGRHAPPGPAHLAPPWGGLWVSTDTCQWHTRSSPASTAHRAQTAAFQEQKTISGQLVWAVVASPSRAGAQPFAANPRNRCWSQGEPVATLAASTGGLCALLLQGETSVVQRSTSLHLGNIQNLEGLLLGSEKL